LWIGDWELWIDRGLGIVDFGSIGDYGIWIEHLLMIEDSLQIADWIDVLGSNRRWMRNPQ
jgi:hypothetical protein